MPDPRRDERYYLALGYQKLTGGDAALAVRSDALERLSREARKLGRQGPFAATPALRQIIEADEAGLGLALAALGYRTRKDESGTSYELQRGRRPSKPKATKAAARRRKPRNPEHSPFAKLRDLRLGK